MTSFPDNLVDRYRRFRSREFPPNADRFEELATRGQQPEIMVVSCCDSRVAPEMIFSAVPGELFVVRNVANLVPPFEPTGKHQNSVSAALEFAVLNLRVKHIVVMGHSSCGGVRVCLDHNAAVQTDAQFISNWMSTLADTRDHLLAKRPGVTGNELCKNLELEGIKTSLANLRSFPFIERLEREGRLSLHGVHFDIATGTLSVLNQASGEFTPV